MNQKTIVIIILVCAITVSVSFLYFKDAWMEPDSTRFYNRACLGAGEFNTPILSEKVFDLIPCNMFAWKTSQLLLILCTISALYFFSKKILKDNKLFLVAFLSYYLLNFLLSIEDDQLALPIIIVLTAFLLDKPTWKNRLLYFCAIVFLSFFVWQASYIPMLIILLWTIEPLLGIGVVVVGIVLQYLTVGIDVFTNPHIGNELLQGQGFITNDLILILFFLVKDKKKKIKENKSIFLLFTAFNLLAFAIPKLGYYSVIPNLMMANVMFDENQKRWLILAGLLALVISPAMFLYDSYPNHKTWDVIEQAVVIQDSGKPLYNEWFLGSWLYYKGGKPTQEGGWQGEQGVDKNEFYWLGPHKKGCNTLDHSGIIRLEYCP